MDGKFLGKIQSVNFGIRDGRLGLHFSLTGEYGVQDSKWTWDYNEVPYTEHCSWTEASRDNTAAGIMKFISDLLRDAKVKYVKDLTNKPIEMEFHKQGLLKSWRILTEVL